MYKPNMINVPQLTEKKDLKVSGNVNIIYPALDVQSAYAISDHFGVMINLSTGQKLRVTDTTNFHRHNFGEVGFGYFSKIGEDGRFGFFGGYGRGRGSAVDRDERFFGNRLNEIIAGTYNRWFVQGEIGMKRNKLFQIEPSFVMRYSLVQFTKYESNFTYDNFNYRRSFIEFAPTVRIAKESVAFFIQPGFVIPFFYEKRRTDSLQTSFTTIPFMLYFGVEYDYKRKKARNPESKSN